MSDVMSKGKKRSGARPGRPQPLRGTKGRSEERFSRNAETDLVCRLLLEKKRETDQTSRIYSDSKLAAPHPSTLHINLPHISPLHFPLYHTNPPTSSHNT